MAEERTEVAFATEFVVGGRKVRGKVKNVSAGGLFVFTDKIPELGETIRLRMSPGTGHQLELTGMVWWSTRDTPIPTLGPNRGFGLRFLDDNPAFREFVEGLR